MIGKKTRTTRTETILPYTKLYRYGSGTGSTFNRGSRWPRTLAPLPSRWLRRTISSTAWPVAAWALQDSAVERSEPAKPRDRMTWAILTTFYPASIPSPAQRQPRYLIAKPCVQGPRLRSEEHTSELQSLMRNSYAVLCL